MPETPAENQSPRTEPWTVRRVLDWTVAHFKEKGCESPRLDAEILLAHVRNCPRIQLYVQYDLEVSEQQRGQYRELVKRRANFEPVAYLVGKREFFGLDFAVSRDVLIPRPDTETLVLELVDFLNERPACSVLELGVGSGCISVATAVHAPQVKLTAVDVSRDALAVARRNAETHRVLDRIELVQGDLFSNLDSSQRFAAIVSNPPYIKRGELDGLHPDVRMHEPKLALDGGADGLDTARRIIDSAGEYLLAEGLLLLELSPETIHGAKSLLEASSAFDSVCIIRDTAGKQRVLSARRTSLE